MGYFEDRPNFTYEGENGERIELAEGELARVIRNNKERIVYCEDVKIGDRIIKF